MKLRIRVEIFTVERLIEDELEIPDEEWSSLSESEREELKNRAWFDFAGNYAGGGCEEMDEEGDQG